MTNVSSQSKGEYQTHFKFNNFLSESRAVYEIMWKNVIELDRT